LTLPLDHPRRQEFNDEVHARPPETLQAPLRLSYLALFAEGAQRQQGWDCVAALTARFGVASPPTDAHHFSADLGPFRVKCERHTEFLRFAFIVPGGADDPFAEPAIGLVPVDWLATLPGQVIVASNVGLLRAGDEEPAFESLAQRFFAGNDLVGASIGAGAAFAVTDFRIHPDGFSRALVLDRSMTPRQAGRSVARLMEIDTYRILSLMALPIARGLAPSLNACERELTEITRLLVAARDADEPLLFERLTRLEAEIESTLSQNLHRFSAAAAYDDLIHRRIAELREERLAGMQTFREFTDRRPAPAMNTCRTTALKLESLSQRVARATQLLTTRVEITREGQSQRLLESMDRRAGLQLRLQETVEGLSVAAITYYIVGLVGYVAKGLKAAGAPLDIEIVMAISIPIVAVLAGLGIRHIRRSVAEEQHST
jgi:uncharacterized membrane-anchored protein